jgi:hypothetical protein
MAIVAGIKVKKKEVKIRNPLFADEKYTGPEPEWPSESVNWPDDQFDNRLRRSFYYYNYFYNQKDCKKYVTEWMKSVGTWDKEQIKAFDRAGDRSVPMTACSLVMAHNVGMTLRERHLAYLTNSINEAIRDAEPEKIEVVATKVAEPYKPTIQDRLAEKTSELIGELEGYYDEIDQTNIKFYDWLINNNVVQSQLVKYENLFQKRKDELENARQKTDPQLVEGYSHYKVADFKKRIKWIEDLLAAIEQYRGVKKATKKARVKKAPSKEKVISKLKYAKEDKLLKIVSINPADIVGSAELWIYNNKTRKLGKYVAASYQTLSVKGTTIIGFDADKSVSKTLRKPEEQLKEFAKAGKIALRTFMKDIKAVETKLNGRIGIDILLLKAS